MKTASSTIAILGTLRPDPGVEQLSIDICFFPEDQWVQISVDSSQVVHVSGMLCQRSVLTQQAQATQRSMYRPPRDRHEIKQ